MASLIWLDMSDGWCQILMANIGKYENCQPFDICKILEVTATIQDRPSQQLQNFPNVHKTDDQKNIEQLISAFFEGGMKRLEYPSMFLAHPSQFRAMYSCCRLLLVLGLLLLAWHPIDPCTSHPQATFSMSWAISRWLILCVAMWT